MFGPFHRAFRAKLGLTATPGVDEWHVNTRQPNEDSATRYAYAHYGLFFSSFTGTGRIPLKDLRRTAYGDVHLQQLPITGLGGIQMGNVTLTALLVGQADAVARGLKPQPQNGGSHG